LLAVNQKMERGKLAEQGTQNEERERKGGFENLSEGRNKEVRFQYFLT
jgi:hypothetical protein